MARRRKTPAKRNWRLVDLHLHTPASSDYREPGASYLDILRQAEARGLDMIAFTDHNTVAGFRALRREIADLELLEQLNRLQPDESHRLGEYRRLLAKIVVLPGFEFTATFGFHILGIFSPSTPVRTIEHVLLSLNVPSDKLDAGSSTVGATSDVLVAYRTIDEAGGIAIAAHANSSNGVAMRGFNFGGQTKIAYTQDAHLHALEVTDLESKSRRSTARFFNGSKPEYPRRMHCIQGSDAHRVTRDPADNKHLGVGDRVTEVQIEHASFEDLRSLFRSDDFFRTQPYRGTGQALDFVQTAREEGPNIVQSFHDRIATRGGHRHAIIADVCALANTNGGTVYVGVSENPRERPVGVANPARVVSELEAEVARRITPALPVSVDALTSQGKKILRITVPRGDDPPYAIDDNQVYVRTESDTSLAVRDEIVQLVLGKRSTDIVSPAEPESVVARVEAENGSRKDREVGPPRTGVEIVATEDRDGTRYHTVRDLRNGNQVKNVTRTSARRLWHYAIEKHEVDPDLKAAHVRWQGDLALVRTHGKPGYRRYDLAQRGPDGIRIYYGVNEDGIHGPWKDVVGNED